MRPFKFFYSYCRADKNDRRELEIHLSLLVTNGIIEQWYDQEIIAGQVWKAEILKSLEESDIVVFLITPNWLSSKACIEEWKKAEEFAGNQPNKKLIPIISKECAWRDFGSMSDLQVLPSEALPVSQWPLRESAWLDIYEGIKLVANDLRKNFQIKREFEEHLQSIEFCSTGADLVRLDDVFVFPNLNYYPAELNGVEKRIKSLEELHNTGNQFIVGDSQSGKSKLGAWVYMKCIQAQKHSILIDLEQIGQKKDKYHVLKECFEKQQYGNFDTWMKNPSKIAIFDNLSKDSKCIDFVQFCESHSMNTIVFCSSDIFSSYYNDDERFAEYREVRIRPFGHSKQEELIKKWVSKKSSTSDSDHALIDTIEENINSIIINNKILPRFPFFILSILQTYESFMPGNLKISAYGHCYHALILARLIKSGIDKEDSALETAFTFCSNLAFRMFLNDKNAYLSNTEFEKFYQEYAKEYLIRKSILNRLFSRSGLLSKSSEKVEFSIKYSYYYFLGKHFSENYKDYKKEISEMIESSFARHNSLILTFTIHHANDLVVIDEILTHTMCAIENINPVKLTTDEIRLFTSHVRNILPEKIRHNGNISDERKLVRDIRTKSESSISEDTKEIEDLAEGNETLNQVFQTFKNIEILSQILKNKTGSLKKLKLLDIVETICDAGLRLSGLIVHNEDDVNDVVKFSYEQYKESKDYDASKSDSYHFNKIQKMIMVRAFLWVIGSIENSIKAINKPELKEIVDRLVEQKNTPAYDLIKYFYLLDSSPKFDNSLKNELEIMTKRYTGNNALFMHRLISIRTQHYEKTHRIEERLRQKIFSLLDMDYRKPGLKNN